MAVGLSSLICKMEIMVLLPGGDNLRVRGLVITAFQSPIFFSFLEKGLALGCGLGLGDLLSVLGKGGVWSSWAERFPPSGIWLLRTAWLLFFFLGGVGRGCTFSRCCFPGSSEN